MNELINIKKLEQAKVLLNPIRVQLLHHLREPATCADLAKQLGISQQRVNAHLKEMLKQDLIKIAKRRRKRNLIEATYEARAKTYWFSPRILQALDVDPSKLKEHLSLNNLLVLSEMVQEEVGLLFENGSDVEIPNVSITAEVYLRDEATRKQFTKDILTALSSVLEKYQVGDDGQSKFKSIFMTYPISTKE